MDILLNLNPIFNCMTAHLSNKTLLVIFSTKLSITSTHIEDDDLKLLRVEQAGV